MRSTHASLNPVYKDLFCLNTQNQPTLTALAVKALQWVFCAFKPLKIDSLAQAVALRSDGSSDPLVIERFLLLVCGNFIIVTSNGSVKFVHRSVKEFLMQAKLPGCEDFTFTSLNLHTEAAKTCLTFLLSFEDASKWAGLPTNLHEDASGLQLTGFELYACYFWALHCAKGRVQESWNRHRHLLTRFLSLTWEAERGREVIIANIAFQRWVSLIWQIFRRDIDLEDWIRIPLKDAISDPPMPLFAACIWGFTSEIQNLITKNSQMHNIKRRNQVIELVVQRFRTGNTKNRLGNTKNQRGKSCLYLACENGHHDIVNTFIHHGAIVNESHEYWGSTLQAAALSGSLMCFESILQNILQPGNLENIPEGLHGRTIDAAISGGNPKIVTIALEAGMEVWLASKHTPFLPRRRRPRSLDSTASETLSDTSSDSSQIPDSPSKNLALSKRSSKSIEHLDLVERLRNASSRRRELLNCWKAGYGRVPAGRQCSDRLAIAKEVSGSLSDTEKESAVSNPFSTEDLSISHVLCFLCLRFIDSSALLSEWR